MDGESNNSLVSALSGAGPEFSECPDCGKEYRPGHRCRESMESEVERSRAAFQIAISTLMRIRQYLIIWRRGEEAMKLKAVSAMARKAVQDIEELIQGNNKHTPTGDNDGKDSA